MSGVYQVTGCPNCGRLDLTFQPANRMGQFPPKDGKMVHRVLLSCECGWSELIEQAGMMPPGPNGGQTLNPR
jgi:hypothetical protein